MLFQCNNDFYYLTFKIKVLDLIGWMEMNVVRELVGEGIGR